MARVAEGADEQSYADIGYHRWVSQCGAQFIPCISERLYHERYQQPDKLEDGKELTWPVPYWWMDIGCTVMLIILAAIDEGLASGFAGPFPHPKGRFRTLHRRHSSAEPSNRRTLPAGTAGSSVSGRQAARSVPVLV